MPASATRPRRPVQAPPRQPLNRLRRYLTWGTVASLLTANGDRGLERYRRIGMTAGTSFVSKAITIFISLVSIPLTIRYLGTERYGVWLTIGSLLTWMALADFGLAGTALVNVIAEADGKDDRELAREYVASAFWTLCFIGGSIGILMATLFQWIPWRAIFKVSESMSDQELYWSCALTILIFVITTPLNLLNSIYSAYQEGFVANMWGMACNVGALVGLLIVSHFKGGVPALIAGTFAARVLVTFVNGLYLFIRRYPWLRPTLSAIRWNRIVRLLRLGGKYQIIQLANVGIYQSQPLIITQFLGPSKVAVFVIAYKIVTAPIDLSYIATTPFVSAFSEAKARDDWRWILTAFKRSTLACLALGIPASFGIAFAGRWIIRLLSHAQAVPDWGVLAWLCVYGLVGMGLMTTGQLLCGLDRVGVLAISLSLSAFMTIGLCILFAHPWGLTGVAAAMAIAKAVTYLPLQGAQAFRITRFAREQIARSHEKFMVGVGTS
jgi:O-antigen/teichoic acid export membrane protein